MSGRKRTPAERSIIYAGVLGGLSIVQIDKILEQIGAPGLNPNSHAMLKGTYFTSMLAGIGSEVSESPNAFGESIFHPKPMGEL
jgi:hypothetical protein